MNKRGFTTVELIVSFTLVSIIVFFLFEILLLIKDLYISTGIKTKLLTKQTVISEMINNDLVDKNLLFADKCANDDEAVLNGADICINFSFDDSTSKKFVVNRDLKSISWGDVTNNLLSGSTFGNIKVSREVLVRATNSDMLNGILTIDIPIYHHLLEGEDYGVNITYQYNSNKTSLANINVSDVVDAEKKVYLLGDDAVKFKDVDYVEPGFYVVDSTTGEIITDAEALSSLVEVSGTIGNEVGETYYLTYTIYDMNKGIMSQATRAVTVLDSEYTYTLTGSSQRLDIPINGTYRIEVWGASGGGTTIMQGKGGYTIGEYVLTTDDSLYISVGGQGTTGSSGVAAVGGYNGGGASGISTSNFASSGGGASDVRLNRDNLSSRIIVAGGGGGGGSRNDSSFACNGGVGGGLVGGIGECSATSYLGGAGTGTAGGAAATYSENITSLPTAGGVGTGGVGASYSDGTATYSAGGGGGGYYGGGGGSRYGGGGGGSGYCSPDMKTCTSYDGLTTFSSASNGYETGHIGNGFARITLISTISN